ncbi:hypothetical protein QF031_001191 [Pseudarthrobacter defluvii]|uniref:DUF3788 family protein n=1 Tax=Pseudarthrobacter defluvii TaxID=410837 RepID=UPI0027867F43|nr:DUF3788 family protein [Pseudarthrobacter defluvii]MDQ0768442.1 hypothetical protein [Pseudarthrobacter defluvii]
MPARVAVLNDPGRVPDDEQIRQYLGASFDAWVNLKETLSGPEFGLELSWHHYRDGGWLCKALQGRKNMAWLAVWEGYATVTCYFSARHRPGLTTLRLPDHLRARIAGAEMSGAMLPVIVELHSPADVEAAVEIIRYRLRAR